jgi:nucleotide-binding universal stress UspA family protein
MHCTRVLCPIDFSAHAPAVVRHALAVAARAHASVVLLHAIEPLLLQAATIAGSERALDEEVRGDLKALVAEATRDLPSAPAPEVVVSEGAAHTAILEVAAREACDLVVMGTHGASGLSKVWFGSTLEHVLRHTTLPVLAIPPRGQGLVVAGQGLVVTHVVAAVDFDEASMAAARVAAARARDHGADLTLLHVVPEAPRWRGWQHEIDRQQAHLHARASQELEWRAVELRAAGTTTHTAVLDGAPAERIATYAADRPGVLVVLGLRSEASRDSARPGVVAYRVLCAGQQPVLFIPSDSVIQ